jgi:membrane protease YdiL (CAAX protease family)
MHASLGSTSPAQRRRLFIVVGVGTLAMALALSSKDALNVWLSTGLVSGFVLLLGFSVHSTALRHVLTLSWGGAGLGIGTGLLMAVLTQLFYPLAAAWLPQLAPAVADLYTYLAQPPGPVAALPVLLLVVMAEEVVWRGVLIDAFPPSLNAVAVVLCSALIYSLPHLAGRSLILFGVAFVCGTIWGLLRMATGSVWVPVLSHLAWNLNVFVFFPLA